MPQPPQQPMWTCGKCQTSNESWRGKCRNCGASKPATDRTFAELWESLPASTRAAVEASVAAAPPIPAEAADVIRRVFSRAGQRIAARRQAERDAA